MSKKKEVDCKVFVGFGGSGCKTLLELARMFAADREMADRSESEAYFLLVDTDQGDLEQMTQDIRRTFVAVGEHPFVGSISLAEGVTEMDTAILDATKQASKRGNEKGLKRFRQVWWFNDDDEPFFARNVQTPPSQGASQCPAISYFLSWKAMQGSSSVIGQTISDLCRSMRQRVSDKHGAASGTTRVSLNLVAGLAGGTGRGCWAPLSFRIQQELQRHNFVTQAKGVFFDQSCYESVQRGGQGQTTKMRINSLTGVSELAGWIDNDLNRKARKGKRFMLRLPSFSSPERLQDDVINVERLIDGDPKKGGASPVSKAYLVFADSADGKLEDDKHYQVAASALYGMTSKTVVQSIESNERIYIGSLGARNFRVDIDRIRDFLTDRIECDSIRNLTGEGTKAKRSGAAGYSEEAKELVEALLSPLMADPAHVGMKDVPDTAERSESNLLMRVQSGAYRAIKGRIHSLLESLEDMDREDFEKAIQQLAKRAAAGAALDEVIATALRESIQHAFGGGMLSGAEGLGGPELFHEYFRSALTSELQNPLVDEMAGSSNQGRLVAHVDSFVICQQALGLLDQRLGEVTAAAEEAAGRKGKSVGEVVKEVKKFSGKKFLVAGKRFDDKELEKIERLLEDLVLGQVRQGLQTTLEKWLSPLKKQLTTWSENLRYAVDAAGNHASDLERVKLTRTREEQVFTTPRELREFRKPPKESGRVYRPDHFLEPFADDAMFGTWLDELQSGSDPRMRDALAAIKRSVLTGAMEGKRSREDQRNAERDLARKLEGFRAEIVIPRSWLVQRFSLMSVVCQLVQKFCDELEDAASSPKQQSYLEDHFRRHFLFELDKKRGKYVPPSDKDIVVRMATNLGRKCSAQYLLTAGDGVERKAVHVFLPTDEKLAADAVACGDVKEDCAAYASKSGAEVDFHVDPALVEGDDDVEARGNPFLMLAMVNEGFELAPGTSGPEAASAPHAAFNQVGNLEMQYRGDGDKHVQTFLRWVEQSDGQSMFADVSYNFGLGYILPAFVTDEGLRSSRWRPWAKDADKAREREASSALDAMLYAMLGNPSKADSRLFKLRVQREDGSKAAWTLPLVKFGGASTKHGFTFGRRAFTKKTGDWDADSRAFLASLEASSISKLHLLFQETEGLQRAVADEAAFFFGTLCTEEGIVERDVQAQFKALYNWIDGTLRARLSKLSNYGVDYEDLVNQLEQRALELQKLKRSELAELYRGV